jgi:hypothetical protein
VGEEVAADRRFSDEDRQRYREKVERCIDALRRMLDEELFETGRDRVGLELEIYLVDRSGTPMMVNDDVLSAMESEDFQTELGQFNIEFNLRPHELEGKVLTELHEELKTSLDHAIQTAQSLDARIVIVGILPTLQDLHVTRENLSRNPRYHLLNEEILAARGEQLRITIEGSERLAVGANSIMMESASTSMQLHLQVDPDDFARYWNAAQAISAPQLAVGCNSPFFLGKELWRETRIALFEQSIDTRPRELQEQGVRPRVWFGERWVDGPLDLFDETVRYFPPLLPILDDEDPLEVLEGGGVPSLPELALLNGTVYRWNRPVYGPGEERPNLRVENRVLPAGPTVVDAIANAAFYYGLVHAIADQEPPVRERLSFSAATENFFAAAKDGIDTQLHWPELGIVAATDLVLEHLLPLAAEGLDRWNVDAGDRDTYLGIIEERCRRHRTGATWQARTFRKLYEDGGLEREEALLEMTRLYISNMRTNEPVHTWPLPGA